MLKGSEVVLLVYIFDLLAYLAVLQGKQGDVDIYNKTLYSSHNRPLHYGHVFFSHPNENGLLVFVVLMLQSSNIA